MDPEECRTVWHHSWGCVPGAAGKAASRGTEPSAGWIVWLQLAYRTPSAQSSLPALPPVVE